MHYTEIAYVLPRLPEKILLRHMWMTDLLEIWCQMCYGCWALVYLAWKAVLLIISLTQTTSLVHTHSIFVCLGIYYNAVLLYTLEMIFRIVTRPQSHFYQSDDEITQCLIYHVISLPTLWLILFRYFMFSEKWHP